VQVDIPVHACHELPHLDEVLGPPEEECLYGIVPHQAVEKPTHLFFIPNEGALNVGKEQPFVIDVFDEAE
jgi:hypothetical protein